MMMNMIPSIWDEHKAFFPSIGKLARVEVKKTYQGTIFGMLWIIMKPVVTLAAFYFVFAFGIRSGSPVKGIDHFDFLLAGFVAWFFMQDAILGGVHCLRKHRAFVVQVKFPVSTIMTITMVARLYVHMFLLCLALLYLLWKGWGDASWLQLLYYTPMMVLFFLVLSWTTSFLAAYSKDFENTVQAGIQGLFWISGILWDTYGMKDAYLRFLMLWNPVNYFANGYRKSLLYHEGIFSQPVETAVFFLEFAVLCIVGRYVYRRMRPTVPDVL